MRPGPQDRVKSDNRVEEGGGKKWFSISSRGNVRGLPLLRRCVLTATDH